MKLTADDQAALKSLKGKTQHIRDAVRGVVKGFHTGLVLWGEGGTGKSYTVIQELQAQQCKYVYHNSRLTARGLVDSLESRPDEIHFIEDAETLLDDKKSYGVLRSALWSQSKAKPPVRVISWTANKTLIRFSFTGGIIIIANANLAETIPEIRAIKTRINVLGLNVPNNELQALMKEIASGGFRYGSDYLSPDECAEVCEFIINKFSAAKKNLDMRLLINGFKDYLQHKTGNSLNPWQVLLEGRMNEQVVYRGRAAVKSDETVIAMEIHSQKISLSEKINQWNEVVGTGQAAYYRALNRAKKR